MTPNINLLNKEQYEKKWDELRYVYFQKIRNNK